MDDESPIGDAEDEDNDRRLDKGHCHQLVFKFFYKFRLILAMARSRISSAYSPCPTQRHRYLEPLEMDSENDSEGVSRTTPQPDGNTSPQSTPVTIPKVLDLTSPILKLNMD